MQNSRGSYRLAIIFVCSGLVQPALADFDQWQISELYSSADGSVQYIELQTTASNQGDLSGLSLTATDDSSQQQSSLTLDSNLVGETANSSLLLATAAFEQQTGLSADFTIPQGFLPLQSGTVDFANGTASISYLAGQLPLNGVQAIDGSVAPQSAIPVNFSGLSASLASPVYASFDTDTSVMNLPVLDVPAVGLANVSFDVNLATIEFTLRNDFYLYAAGITAGDSAARLQPGNVLYLPSLLLGDESYELNLALLAGDPVVFGSPSVLSVTNITPEPGGEPEPEPDPLQESIDRGQTLYAQHCTSCHGSNGGGGIGPILIGTTLTFASLRLTIDTDMPQTSPAACVDSASSTCATDVANFVLNVLQP